MSKYWSYLLFCLLLSGKVFSQYAPVLFTMKGVSKTSVSLNGTWKFNANPSDKDFVSGKIDMLWDDIQVPAEWVMQGFHVEPGVRALYKKEVIFPKDWKNKKIMLRFDGVYSDAIVWVNSNKVTVHQGGFNAFECDISPFVNVGSSNVISVGVKEESLADTLSCGSQYAAHPIAGIIRKVTCFVLEKTHITDLTIQTGLDENYSDADLKIGFEITNDDNKITEAQIGFLLTGPDNQAVFSEQYIFPVSPRIRESKSFTFPVKNPLKWTAETPVLYNLKITLTAACGEQVIERNVGFREIEIVGNQLYVNGKPVKLKGVNRHEVHPLKGRSLSLEQWRKDALIFKAGNVNFIRTSHYPPAEEFVHLCDSAGLFVELENPLTWIGHHANLKLPYEEAWNQRLLPELLKTTRETLHFYKNHPSIIIWSLANESAWTDNWAKVLEEAERIDPTRPIAFHDQSYGGFNNYGSTALPIANIHYPGPSGPGIANDFERPLLFGEYCHLNAYNRQEIATDPGVRDAWVRGFYPMWENMYKSRGCLGGAIWSGIDDVFMLPGDQLVGYGEWGPIDAWRRPKPEYYHMKKTYTPVKIFNTRIPDPGRGGDVRLQIENRFDFTDLKDCRIEWQIQGKKGEAHIALSPRSEGILVVKTGAQNLDGEKLRLKIYSPGDLLIDEYEVEIGNVSRTNYPFQLPPNNYITVSTKDNLIKITSGPVAWSFDKTLGKIINGSVNNEVVISDGAELMMLALHSEECKTEHSFDIAIMNKTCSNWSVRSIELLQKADTAEIKVAGSYDEADVDLNYLFLGDGTLTINYELKAKHDINTRQIGLVFSVPSVYENLKWYREGFWSTYPEWHIGRVHGETTPFPSNAFFMRKYGDIPSDEWRFDANSLGTNDFRSSKDNIYWASLTNIKGNGILVSSDGNHSFRSFVNDGKISFLAADYFNGGAEIFFRSHLANERNPLKRGDHFRGSITLNLINGEKK